MYAILAISGRQIKAVPEAIVRLDYMDTLSEGDSVTFDKVLLCSDGADVKVGTPYVAARVMGTVVAHYRDKKVIVFKKKRRVDYHKKQGHRQWYTDVRIDTIEM